MPVSTAWRWLIGAAFAITITFLLGLPPAMAVVGQVRSLGAAAAPEIVAGEVIVRYKAASTRAARGAVIASVRGRFSRSLLLERTDVITVPAGTEAAAALTLARNPAVESAEVNSIQHIMASPNDTRLTELWGINNTGQVVNGTAGVADADIDGLEAWKLVRGVTTPVLVAVIDTGIAMTHPDLAARIYTNPGESGGGKETNGLDDDGDGVIDDVHGWDFVNNDNDPTDDHNHGTHVSGTIGGISNNAAGVAGVASLPTNSGVGIWGGPKLLPIKVCDAGGSCTTTAIVNGIVLAGKLHAKVANISLGGAGTRPTEDAAIAGAPNTLFVISAGNDGVNNDTSPHAPCVSASATDQPNKICVAATNSSDGLASFSNYGLVNVDLGAPGVSVLSSIADVTSYAFFNGTSMATPHVVGAAALLFAKFPAATVAAIKNRILTSVDHIPALAGKTVTGGRLNLYKAGADSLAFVSGGVLQFSAGVGETNNVIVTKFIDAGVAKYRITDYYSTSTTAPQAGSRIAVAAGCAILNTTAVKCAAAGITRIAIGTGDLNDTVNAAGIIIPLTINGGDGNDTLTGGTAGDYLVGGPGADRFIAGPGNDTIIAKDDVADLLFSCGENAGDHDVVDADSTPNDPVVTNAANCEVVTKH